MGEEELGLSDREGSWIKLEKMNWRRLTGKGKAEHPRGVWLSDVGEKAGQGQSKAVVGV